MKHVQKISWFALGLAALVLPLGPAFAFCGFYVAKADTELFNDASKVVMVRDGDRTVITMASDYRGEASEFAMVVPVPTVLEEGQIHVTENKIVDHLDAYTSPRLVEFFDPDPCRVFEEEFDGVVRMMNAPQAAPAFKSDNRSLGVTVEAE